MAPCLLVTKSSPPSGGGSEKECLCPGLFHQRLFLGLLPRMFVSRTVLPKMFSRTVSPKNVCVLNCFTKDVFSDCFTKNVCVPDCFTKDVFSDYFTKDFFSDCFTKKSLCPGLFHQRLFLSPPPEGGLGLVTNRQGAI